MPLKRISVHNTTYPIDRTFNLFDASSAAGSSSSGSYLSVRWYTTNIEGLITEPYNGMKIAVKIPRQGVATAGVVLSINGNNANDYHPVAYNVSSVLTSHYAVGAIKTFVYDATATMACYLTSNTKTTVTGVWKAEADYDSNTTMTYGTLAYYLRPYAAQTIYDYRFVMQDKDNRLVPLVTDNIKVYNSGTSYTVGTKIFYNGVFYNCIAAGKGKTPPNATYWEVITPTLTPTAMAFKPDKIYWYNTTTTIAAGAAIGGNTLMSVGYNATNISTGNFPVLVPTYKMIYLCGTYNQTTGLFTLRDGGTASNNYYTLVPDNTANLTLSTYFTEGYDYILLGGSYSTAGYIHLREDHPMYHFDGTNLVPYDTYDINTQVQANPTLAGTESSLSSLQIGDTKYKLAGGNDIFEAIYETDYDFTGPSGELVNLSANFRAALEARRDFTVTFPATLLPARKYICRYMAEATVTIDGGDITIIQYQTIADALTEDIGRFQAYLDSTGHISSSGGIDYYFYHIPQGLAIDNTTKELGLWDGDSDGGMQNISPYGNTIATSDIVEAGLPTFSSSDVNKVLSIDSNGDLIWITAQAGPMVFKGTLGTGGTITSLPTASASTLGWTYKVIEAGTYASIAAKEGDLFICANTGTDQSPTYAWTLIPAGNELTDVQINGASIVNHSTNIANFNTQSAYNASTNKIATMADISTDTNTTTDLLSSNKQLNSWSNNNWSAKTWSGSIDTSRLEANNIWTDGENIYLSTMAPANHQRILDKSTSTWSAKTWEGLTSFYGEYVWTDGNNIYYSYNSNQYVLDKAISTWSAKSWNGLTSFEGNYIWTDGTNIYYSYNENQYVLDKSTSTWSVKSWVGLTNFDARFIWTDGTNIYYSYNENQYVLDKSTATWSTKTWKGLTRFYGYYIWTDGNNIYYSQSSTQYVLDKSTFTWSAKTWSGLTSFYGYYIWTDGNNIYCSCETNIQYVLDKTIQKNTSCKTKLGYDYETQVINKPDVIIKSQTAGLIKNDGSIDTNTYYLASNPNGYTTNTGTITSIATSGTGLSGGTITTSGTITLDSSAAGNAATNKVVLRNAAGSIQSEKIAISSGTTTKATMQYNSTDDCIDFIFS